MSAVLQAPAAGRCSAGGRRRDAVRRPRGAAVTPRARGPRRRLAGEGAAQVFITEALLTTLMCVPRSVYSWDVVATRAGGQLFFDRHDGSEVELLTAAETAPEAVAEDRDALNGVQQLSQEATAVNQNFCQQARARRGPARPERRRALCARAGRRWGHPPFMLSAPAWRAQVLLHGQEGLMGDEANPFQEEGNEQLASVAYRRAAEPVMRGALPGCRRCLLPRAACPSALQCVPAAWQTVQSRQFCSRCNMFISARPGSGADVRGRRAARAGA